MSIGQWYRIGMDESSEDVRYVSGYASLHVAAARIIETRAWQRSVQPLVTDKEP